MNIENFIKETLFQSGEKILGFFGNPETLYAKETVVDIVTQADITSNELISKAIKKNYPSHGIISEEGEGYQTDSDYIWYIDPLDGTKNFASHTPLFGINIALVFKGDVTHAAVYLPYLKDYIYAEKGKGAFLNGKKAFCSQKEDWQGAYGLGTMMFKSEYKIFQEGLFDLSNGTCWTNAVASSAVAGLWVSSGKRDWYIGPSQSAWDYVATSLIAKESGCIVSNFEGFDYKPGDRGLVVANKFLFPQLIELVKKSYFK